MINTSDLIKFGATVLVGAVVAIGAGFGLGQLTTTSSAEDAAAETSEARTVAYCTANARKMVANGDHRAPRNDADAEALAEAALLDLLPEETFTPSLIQSCAANVQSS